MNFKINYTLYLNFYSLQMALSLQNVGPHKFKKEFIYGCKVWAEVKGTVCDF